MRLAGSSATRMIAAIAAIGWIAWRAAGGGPVAQLALAVALASFVAFRPAPLLAQLAWLHRWARPGSAYAIVIAVSAAVFGPPMRAGRLGNLGDWPVNEAIARELFDAYAEGRTPSWLAGTSVGDPTSDLYPTTLHTIVARGALLLGSHEWIHPLLVAVALAGYTLGAVAVTRLALRGSTWSAAVLLGVVVLIDAGSELFTWGTLTTWYWGLLPSTISIGVGLLGLADLLDLEERPTRARIVRVWILYAITAVLHPIGLIVICAWIASFLARGIFGDPRARSSRLMVVAHIAIGAGLSSFAWLPSANRVLEFGLHFGTPQVPISLALERMLTGALPDTSYPMLITLGYVGGLLAIGARRSPAFPLLLAIGALVMLYADPVFLEAGLAPSRTTVRLQSFRIGTIAAPIVYAAAAFALAPGRWWQPPPGPGRTVRWVGSIVALVACVAVSFSAARTIARDGSPQSILGVAVAERSSEREDFLALAAHLRAEREAMPEDQFARAIYGSEPEHPHHLLFLWWLTGVPIASRNECNACFFLREQMYDLSGANVDRFAIRWAIGIGRAPIAGDPATERVFGRYRLREITSWTGELARVVEGRGRVRLERATAGEVALSLEGDAPALVELGIPYYPRWRAYDEQGTSVPVYASSGVPGERVERTLAVWMRPGRLVLRPDGALLGERGGVLPTLLAMLAAALAFPSAWRRRRLARVSDAIENVMRGWPWRSIAIAAAALAVVLMLAMQGAFGGVARAVRIGVFFPRAEVSIGGVRCAPDRLGRSFTCPDGTRVFGEMMPIVNEVSMGWRAPSPGISIEADHRVEVVIRIPLRLEGTYYGACTGSCVATLRAGGVEQALGAETVRLEVPPGAREVELTIRTSRRASLAVIGEPALDLDRMHDVPWAPASPPAR